jgi:outer membrane protein OmpA-like peptidoglycan-associated protein
MLAIKATKWIVVAMLFCISTVSAFGQNIPGALDATPLSQRVSGQLQAVSNEKNIPAIAWGADVLPLLAESEGIFAQNGLRGVTVFREDILANQVGMVLRGETPYLRGTTDMIAQASLIFEAAGTKLVPVFQYSWSTGDDGIGAREHIRTLDDLRGEIIAAQLDGPHAFLILNALSNKKLPYKSIKNFNEVDPEKVNIVWMKDLLYAANDSGPVTDPITLFKLDPRISAVCGIYPDLAMLTSDGKVGDGSENSVKGAHILYTTASAAGVTADLLAVRLDYFSANRAKVEAVVRSLLLADERLRAIVANRATDQAAWQQRLGTWAEFLLDARELTSDMEAMVSAGGMTLAGQPGNVAFFQGTSPRNLNVLTNEINTSFMAGGLMTRAADFGAAQFDWNKLGEGLTLTAAAAPSAPRFDSTRAQRRVEEIIAAEADSWSTDGTLFVIEITFQPNQDEFAAADYAKDFAEALRISQTYSGAIVVIEGHGDPMGVLRARQKGENATVIAQMEQSLKNLSLQRSQNVRAAFLQYCSDQGFQIDGSQFLPVGMGAQAPKFSPPRTEAEWKANMRVSFVVKQIEAELDAFVPLD